MRIVMVVPIAALTVAVMYGCSASSEDRSLALGGNRDAGGGGSATDDSGPSTRTDGDANANDAATSHDAASTDGAQTSDAIAPPGSLNALQKHKAEMLTSIWENSTTVLQYPYCQNIHDGRGYTSGRAGFCSGTGDAIQVVQCFDAAFGNGSNNPMAKYMPALTTINDRFNTTGQDQAGTAKRQSSMCLAWPWPAR